MKPKIRIKALYDQVGSPTSGIFTGRTHSLYDPEYVSSPQGHLILVDDVKHACGAERTLSQKDLDRLCGEEGGTLEQLQAEKADWRRAFE